MSIPNTEHQFLHLLRCGVRQEAPNSEMFTSGSVDWANLINLSEKQAVSGLIFWAVRQLPSECQPPRQEYFLPWLSSIEEISRRNKEMDLTCRKVVERFRRAGFHACILKGQGAARMYADPSLRIAGDIDVWVWPYAVNLGEERSLSARRTHIIEYVWKYRPDVEVVYHHMDFNVLKRSPMEVHFTPSWMNSPLRNHRLQRWFEQQAPLQFKEDESDEFCTPTVQFNAIYMLLHIFRHLFNEGIGLRQIVDYYYLLNQEELKDAHTREEILHILRRLGLKRFCGALMWVLGELFGLEESLMLVPPREREGSHLLEEILLAGNFGISDTRFHHYANGTLGAFWTRTRRNISFIHDYPSEALWTPLWKIGHYLWRFRHHYLP